MTEQRDGFGVVTRDVALDPGISTTAKAVYLVLAVHRDLRTNECFPANSTVASALGIHRRSVMRALNELAEAGVIERRGRFRDGRQVSSISVLTDAVARRRKKKAGGQ